MTRAAPPGVSAAALDRAFARFAQIVGAPWVFTSEEDRNSYLDPFAPGDGGAFAPSGAVAPASVAEVQAVVRAAGEFAVPLWTVSAGKNLAYGGASPRLSGCVVLDLKRMRSIEVDEELAYAAVEPGVTFFDLFDHLQAHDLKLWISSPAPGWGSVMGNALERGFGPMPYGDHAEHVCGLEVVLADGSLVRTGMGAVAGSSTFHTFKSGFGPAYDGLFMQSNFGVVTKLGIWLMPQPEAATLCEVKFRRETDLAAAVDALRPLRIRRVIPSIANMRNAVGVAAGTTTRADWWSGQGPLPDAVIDGMIRKLGIGWWNMSFALYGTEDLMAGQLKTVREAFDAVPDAELNARVIDGGALSTPARGGGGSRVGVPGLAAFQLPNWRGGAGAHIDFSPVLAPRGADAWQIYRMSKRLIEEGGFDFIGTFYNFGRAMALICAIVFDRNDGRDTNALRAIFGRLIRQAGAAGFGEYRTHLAYMDEVAAQYGWNDHALLRLSRSIKRTLDPKGILSPGKQGIWLEKIAAMTPGSDALIVDTPTGKVRGSLENGVRCFKGLRYAASTAGANRFRPPQPAAPWGGIQDVRQFGASAPQSNPAPPAGPSKVILGALYQAAGVPRPAPLPESEDCLFLNVWTAAEPAAARPVMVWLHGGFFAGGSGSTVDGSALARGGDVVVVSLNHRLNVLGFTDLAQIGGDEFRHSGNLGMLDILAALQWIRDTIDRFGGDPARVMVFGESGGGMKTAFLLACPEARGLLHRAAIQSGPTVRMLDPGRAGEVTARLLHNLGLRKGALDALRSMSVERLLTGYFATAAAFAPRSFTDLSCFAPVLDPRLLPDHPFTSRTDVPNADVPLLIGWNRDEMSFFMGDDPQGFVLDAGGLDSRLAALEGGAAGRVLDEYRRQEPGATPSELFIRIWSDISIREPTLDVVDRRLEIGGSPTYLYRFDARSPALGGKLGSMHTLEAPFVFDTTEAARLLTGGGAAAAALGSAMSSAWKRFAATGNPNGPDLPVVWPEFEPHTESVLVWDRPPRVLDAPWKAERRALGGAAVAGR